MEKSQQRGQGLHLHALEGSSRLLAAPRAPTYRTARLHFRHPAVSRAYLDFLVAFLAVFLAALVAFVAVFFWAMKVSLHKRGMG